MDKLIGKTDKSVFWVSTTVCLFFVAWGLLFPEQAEATFNEWLVFFTSNFGWLYLIVVASFVVFLFFLCFHKVGNIKLGKDSDQPTYKISSWFFMMFIASMGIGMMFWGVAEPIYHLMSPPFNEPPGAQAAQTAMRTSFMHWGLHPWAVYSIVGISLAYWQFRKDKPALISSTLIPLYGERGAKGWMGKSVDILAVFATVFGVAASLGFGAKQIAGGLNYVYGTPNTTAATVLIVLVLTALFICSAVSGIDKGILFLSNINIWLCIALMAFILIAGPTVFILNVFTDTTGAYLHSLLQLSFWTDPYQTNPGWLSSWTVFYWAWWLSWGPFVGGFIARISKGRTVREFIIGALFCPVLVCFIWFSIMGGTAIHFELGGNHVISEAVTVDVANAFFAMLGQLPFPVVLCALATVLIGIFFITSADSATFVCAMMTSFGVQEPKRNLKIFWGIVEGLVAAVLLITGGITALRTVSIVAAFPFMFVCVALMVSMYKSFMNDPYITKQREGKSG